MLAPRPRLAARTGPPVNNACVLTSRSRKGAQRGANRGNMNRSRGAGGPAHRPSREVTSRCGKGPNSSPKVLTGDQKAAPGLKQGAASSSQPAKRSRNGAWRASCCAFEAAPRCARGGAAAHLKQGPKQRAVWPASQSALGGAARLVELRLGDDGVDEAVLRAQMCVLVAGVLCECKGQCKGLRQRCYRMVRAPPGALQAHAACSTRVS